MGDVVDPSSQTEDLGDDAILASMYGIKNLKRIVPNLIEWTTSPGEDYSDLSDMYGQVLSQFNRYMYHVHNIIGGIYNTPHNSNQKGVATYLNVDVSKQKEALNFLEKNLWNTQNWLMKSEMISQIKSEGILNSTKKKLSKPFLDLVFINTIIPLQFCYQQSINSLNEELLFEKMKGLKPEKNSIISKFSALKIEAKNAFESQALLELKNNYCESKRCLDCAIGSHIITI